MSNPLSARRVMVQTIRPDGTPDGPPSYGVLAADNYEQSYNDSFESLAELNTAIATAPSILGVTQEGNQFDGADHEKIGRGNFYGGDWRGPDPED